MPRRLQGPRLHLLAVIAQSRMDMKEQKGRAQGSQASPVSQWLPSWSSQMSLHEAVHVLCMQQLLFAGAWLHRFALRAQYPHTAHASRLSMRPYRCII